MDNGWLLWITPYLLSRSEIHGTDLLPPILRLLGFCKINVYDASMTYEWLIVVNMCIDDGNNKPDLKGQGGQWPIRSI